MLARILFLLVLTAPVLVHANVWTCVTGGDLSGDPSYYWAHGRDSWTGKGMIECTSGRRILRVATQVRFEGRDPGIGAGPNSRIAFESLPVVTRAPVSLAQKDLSVSQESDPEVWISTGNKVNLSFYIFSNQWSRFAGSINRGKLNINVIPAQP